MSVVNNNVGDTSSTSKKSRQETTQKQKHQF
jgi:hypothetical protein